MTLRDIRSAVIGFAVIATKLRHPSQKVIRSAVVGFAVIGFAVIATKLRHPSQKVIRSAVIGCAVITQSV